jgi:hypothetical protein
MTCLRAAYVLGKHISNTLRRGTCDYGSHLGLQVSVLHKRNKTNNKNANTRRFFINHPPLATR